MIKDVLKPALALLILIALGATVMFYHPEQPRGATIKVEMLK